LWVLFDAVRDSVWLREIDVAELRARLFTHLEVTIPPEYHHSVGQRPSGLDPDTARSVYGETARILHSLTEHITPLGDADHRRAAQLLLETISSISRNAVGGAAATQRDDGVDELRHTVDGVFEHGADSPMAAKKVDPAMAAQKKAHDRLWMLVRRTTDMVAGLDLASGRNAGTAIYYLAAIPPAAVWIPALGVESCVDALWQPLADVNIVRPEVLPAWVDDPPPNPEDVDLRAVQGNVWEGLMAAHAGLQRTGESGPSPRNVTEILAGWLRSVAVILGDFDIKKDSTAVKSQPISDDTTIGMLFDAVDTHVRAWEDEAEQARRRQDRQDRQEDRWSARPAEADGVAAQWHYSQTHTEADPDRTNPDRTNAERGDVKAQRDGIEAHIDDRPGDDTQLAQQLAMLRKQLDTQRNAIANMTEKIAYDLRDLPPGGDLVPLMSYWFRGLQSAVQGLDTRAVLNALDEHQKRRPAESPASRAVPSGRPWRSWRSKSGQNG
jgi:hypothetical protein